MRSRHLPGLPVLAIQSGTAVGRVREPVIDPEKKQVAALLISKPRTWSKWFLPVEAVRAIGRHAVTVGSEEALIPLKQDQGLYALLTSKKVPVVGTAVVTAGGELVGVARDFEIDQGGAISRLYVSEGAWRSLAGRERPIARSELVALGKDAVIVTEETLERLSGESEVHASQPHGSKEETIGPWRLSWPRLLRVEPRLTAGREVRGAGAARAGDDDQGASRDDHR